jgi:AraC-like DNA-binding protein
MKSRWTGSLYLTEHFLGYEGPVDRTELHAHHAIQIALAREGRLRLRDAKGRLQSGRAAVVPRDTAHAIAAPAESVLILYVNPDHLAGRRIARLSIGESASAWFAAGRPLARLAFPEKTSTADDFERAAAEITQRLVGELADAKLLPTAIHPAVRRLLSSLPSRLDGDVRLPSLAKDVGLSAGRLGHLFTETVGIPLRPYILWLRLQRAAAEVRDGGSLTNAAHAAGFTDASHLSNTFRRTFGLSPSNVATSVRWVASPKRLTGIERARVCRLEETSSSRGSG